jgi:uncharacterized protein (DUF924 family)
MRNRGMPALVSIGMTFAPPTAHDPRIEELLGFWFGGSDDDAEIAASHATLWWQHDPVTDADVRRRYQGLAELAAAGWLDGWTATPHGRLALVLLHDQVPRNVWRGTPRAFATDARARWVARQALGTEEEVNLRPIHRVFLYLPLEHAEDAVLQEESVRRMRTLADGVPSSWREAFELFVDYAERHRHVIARFGRFPHRNAILGRTTTPDEAEFLAQPGSSF